MNPMSLFMLLALQSETDAWQFPSIQQTLCALRLSSSCALPSFLLESGHPWIVQHQAYLESLEDAAALLCNLSSPLRPGNSGEAPYLTYPIELFKSLEINTVKYGRPSGWAPAVARLAELSSCPAALSDVQDFQFEIYGQPPSPAKLEAISLRVAHLLASMPQLKRLEWNTFGNGNDVFKQTFQSLNLTLPSVKHLVLAVNTHWLVNACPNIEVLESGSSIHTATMWRPYEKGNPREELIDATRRAEKLTSFSLEAKWTVDLLERLVGARPSLTTLSIYGEIREALEWGINRFQLYGFDDMQILGPADIPKMGDFNFSKNHYSRNITDYPLLQTYLRPLLNLPHLTSLSLPASTSFGMGSDTSSGCGNAYFGPGGRAVGRLESMQYAQATEHAGGLVLGMLPGLERLCMGYCANVTRDEAGRARAVWGWTGRVEEWVWEVWPETDEDDPRYEF